MVHLNTSKVLDLSAGQTKHVSAEEEKLKAEYRMFGSLLLIFGLCSAYASLAGLTNLSEAPVINTVKVVVFVDGLVLMAIGYSAAVLDKGSTTICSIAIGLSLLTLIQFIARFIETLRMVVQPGTTNIYIHSSYNPTEFDVRYIALMSFILYASLLVGYVGSLCLVSFSMRSIQAGVLQDYSSKQYKTNSSIITMAFAIYGCSQLSIGCFLLDKYGAGPLPYPITNAGILKIICFPEISVAVGLLQLMTGIVGFVRSLCGTRENAARGVMFRSIVFQSLCLLTYISIIALQVLTQIAFASGNMGSQYAVSLPCNHVAFMTTMAFFDWKIKTAESIASTK
jgi:hypothetical protein